MINFFIDNDIWLHTIIVISLILIFVGIIFRLTKHWRYSDRTDMRFFGSLLGVLVIAFLDFCQKMLSQKTYKNKMLKM